MPVAKEVLPRMRLRLAGGNSTWTSKACTSPTEPATWPERGLRLAGGNSSWTSNACTSLAGPATWSGGAIPVTHACSGVEVVTPDPACEERGGSAGEARDG
eukprot:6990346-Alexandrium_andersonii.AAC.1